MKALYSLRLILIAFILKFDWSIGCATQQIREIKFGTKLWNAAFISIQFNGFWCFEGLVTEQRVFIVIFLVIHEYS